MCNSPLTVQSVGINVGNCNKYNTSLDRSVVILLEVVGSFAVIVNCRVLCFVYARVGCWLSLALSDCLIHQHKIHHNLVLHKLNNKQDCTVFPWEFVLDVNKFTPEGVDRLERCWNAKGFVIVLKSFGDTRDIRNGHLTSLDRSIIILLELLWLRLLLGFVSFGEYPVWIYEISQPFVDVIFIFCDILGVANNGVSLVMKCPDHLKFVDKGVMGVKLKVMVCVRRFMVYSRIEGSIRIEHMHQSEAWWSLQFQDAT